MLSLNNWLSKIGLAIERDDAVENIALDSRQVDEHTWWLAPQGVSHHALDFYDATMPCAGILYQPPYTNPPKDAIAVPNLSWHVSALAGCFYGEPSKQMRVIGVTGTDGKSSLVHFIAQALDATMLGTIGYGKLSALQEASHTTPDALMVQKLLAQFLSDGADTVAMEVSSHALVQGRVADVHFDTAVFSNLSRDHLDYHHDMEDYFLAKASLFARPIKHAIINIDDDYGRRLITENRIDKDAEVWTVSSRHAQPLPSAHQLTAEAIQLTADGIVMRVNYNGEAVVIHSRLLARFNVDNLLNVMACLLSGGKSLAETVELIHRLHGVPGRAERIMLGHAKSAIVDYAHTAGAIESVLQGIRPHVQNKLWIVFGCGGDRDKGKRPMMARSAEQFADYVVVTDDNPRTENPDEIIRDIQAGFVHPGKVHIVQPRDEAIYYALSKMQTGDVLLIAGKGHEDYQIIGTIKHHFSDQETVQAWLKR